MVFELAHSNRLCKQPTIDKNNVLVRISSSMKSDAQKKARKPSIQTCVPLCAWKYKRLLQKVHIDRSINHDAPVKRTVYF